MVLRVTATVLFDDKALHLLAEELVGRGRLQRLEPTPSAAERQVELPPTWQLIGEEHGVIYTWGDDRDEYDPFLLYEGRISGGPVRLAIGKCKRVRTFGRSRPYYIVIAIGPAGGKRAVSEFLATDDYDETHEVIAIIRGRDGTGRLFDSPSELPAVYSSWSTVVYRERVDYPRAYVKQALVCDEQDHETMLNHSLAQIQLRNLNS